MHWWVGTSGFSYPKWRGYFYPEDLPAADMLAHYAGRLPSVELNNTFYRMPKRDVLEGWASRVPAGFRFAIKASRRITHIKRLKEPVGEVEFLYRNLGVLGDRLGIVLFQLPPTLRKDVPRLLGFLDLLPSGGRAAVEFRIRGRRVRFVRAHQSIGAGGAVCANAPSHERRASSIIGSFAAVTALAPPS